MPSISTEEDLERLLRKLTTTERVVVGLLAADGQSSVVEKKLTQLEELIADIPSCRDDLANNWNDKVVKLWARFAGGNDDVQLLESSSTTVNASALANNPENVVPVNGNVTASHHFENTDRARSPSPSFNQNSRQRSSPSPHRRMMRTTYSNQQRFRNQPPRFQNGHAQQKNFSRNFDNNTDTKSFVDSTYGTARDSPNSFATSTQTNKPIEPQQSDSTSNRIDFPSGSSFVFDDKSNQLLTDGGDWTGKPPHTSHVNQFSTKASNNIFPQNSNNTTSKPFNGINNTAVRSSNAHSNSNYSAAPNSNNGKVSIEITDAGINWGEVSPKPLTTTIDEAIPIPSLENGDINQKVQVPMSCSGAISPLLSEPANFEQKPLEEQRPSSSLKTTTQKYDTAPPPSASHRSTYVDNRYQNKPFIPTRAPAPAYKVKPQVDITDAGIDWGSVSPPLKEVTPEKSEPKTLNQTNKTTNNCSFAPQSNSVAKSSGDSFTFTSNGLLQADNPPPPKANYKDRYGTANTFVPRITPICESPDPVVHSSFQHRSRNKIDIEITDAGIDWGSASPEPSTDKNKSLSKTVKQQLTSAAPLKSTEPDHLGPKVVTASRFDNNRQSFNASKQNFPSNQVSSADNAFKPEFDSNFDWGSEPIIPKDSNIKICAQEKSVPLSSMKSTENSSFEPKVMTAAPPSVDDYSRKPSINNSYCTSKPVAACNAKVQITDAGIDWAAGPTSPEPTVVEPMRLDVNSIQSPPKETSKFVSVDNSNDNYSQEEWAQESPSMLIKQRLANNYRKSLNPPGKFDVTITDAGIDWGAQLEPSTPKSNEKPSNCNLNHQDKKQLQSSSSDRVEPNVSSPVKDYSGQSSYNNSCSYKTRTEAEVPNDFDWGSAPPTPQISVSKVPEKLAPVQPAQQPLNSKVDHNHQKSDLLSSSKSSQMEPINAPFNAPLNKFSNNSASSVSNSYLPKPVKPARFDVQVSNDFDWGSVSTAPETSAPKVPENLAASSSVSKPTGLNRFDSKPSTNTNNYNSKSSFHAPSSMSQSNFVKSKPASTYNYNCKVEIEITDAGINWGEASPSPPPDPPTDAPNDLGKILTTFESDILELLPEKPLPVYKIEGKINLMVQLIGEIPREESKLCTKWSEKFADLMDNYTITLKSKTNEPVVEQTADKGKRPERVFPSDIEVLEHQLDTSALDLLRLMDVRPLPPNLKRDMSYFKNDIKRIPPESVNMLNKWTERFAYYVKKYNHVQSTNYEDDCESQVGSVISITNERLLPEQPATSALPNNDSLMGILRQDLDNLEMNIVSLLSLDPKGTILDSKITELEELIQIIPPGCEKDSEIWINKVAKFREQYSNGNGLSLSSHNSTSQLPTVGSPGLPQIGNIDQLLKDLASLESTIEKILLTRPLENDKFERNIALLAESIMAIPVDQFDLVDIWSKKVVDLMQKFVDVDVSTNSSVFPSADDRSHLVAPTSTNFDIRSEIHLPAVGLKVEYTKVQVRAKFCDAFQRLEPVLHGADQDRLKMLLVMLAKARKISQPFLPDQLLYTDLFGYAWIKLPSEICEKFNADCENGVQKKTLSSLIFFLIDYLKQIQDSATPQRQGNSSYLCAFCMLPGHIIQDCMAIKNNLCFNCFNYGHLQKQCTSKNLVSSEQFLALFNSFY